MKNMLRNIRKSHNYTQSELAYMCDVDRNTIGRIEAGKEIPRMDLALKIAFIFGNILPFKLQNGELNELKKRMDNIWWIKHFPD